jgi:hypothetical protein
MKENIQKLMEEFNEQYPNGDSFELAEFMYRKGFDDGYVKGYEDEGDFRDEEDE